MAPHFFILCTLLTFSSCFDVISAAMNYVVTIESPNHPGSIKFNKIIGGIPYTKQTMGKVNNFIWSTIFKQNTPAERKPINTVLVTIKDYKGAEAITWDENKINVSAVYLDKYEGDLKWEFTSLLYHEMTHVFQWYGEGKCPVSLQEGVADYTILKANYFPPKFAKRGQGDKWDQGYDYTARFLEYCDGLVPDFVAKLNKMMRKTYDESFFKTLTGKPVGQLWKEYKAKYAGKPGAKRTED
ncbi:hypothetical protein QVD17_12984 [Tagetes erecta]|uniref:Plant basic secretory protein (BSP) family protein n=1 Tax=Tagetes erecta TaxID=13708 RepID=A0AAD8KW95_TARER|nr:hypothetical protein QVD17_12984 [Tagetes erecta]